MGRNIIRLGMDAIASADEVVATALADFGYPEPRVRTRGFEAFLSIIVSQQLSNEAAATILDRVRGLLPEMSPDALLELPETSLREAGLSGRKVEYATGLARAISEGQFDLDQLEELDDEEAIREIIAIRGFGRWSAEVYLLFSLQRQDIFPADDLALQVALQRLRLLEFRPAAAVARRLVGHWAPWRSVGSLFLWHFYRWIPA